MLPREKLLVEGPEALRLEELISVVLNTGVRQLNVFELAHKVTPLLSSKRPSEELKTQLQSIPGLGETKIAQLLAIIEIARRLSKEPDQRLYITHPSQVVKIFSFLKKRSIEYFYVELVSASLEHICFKLIAKGKRSYVSVTPKDIIRIAIRYNAEGVILVHNHPSGDPTPSKEDLKTTEAIIALGNLLNIQIVDHVIISANGYYSFKEHGKL